MASSFPKMQKRSASFSQSIRNRLRLKKLQAQAKNFCRVLDIRVAEVMEPNFGKSCPFQHPMEHIQHTVRGDWTSVGRREYILDFSAHFLSLLF